MKSVKAPVWEEENVPSSYEKKFGKWSEQIVKQNENIKQFLLDNGWSFWDSCNVWEHGFSLTFEKYVGDIRLLFDFHWMDECQVYWWGSMRACHKYFPDDKYLCPIGHFEIDSIIQRFLNVDTFSKMEENLISAIKSQKVIK